MTDIAHFPRPGQNYPYVHPATVVFVVVVAVFDVVVDTRGSG